MRKRPLGKTGLRVSEMAIGTWGLSGDAYGEVAESDAEAVLRRAFDIGLSLVDTSGAYAGGRMEALIGRVLVDYPEVALISKVGIDRTTSPARRHFEADHIKPAIEASLKRLGRERIEILLLHNPSPDALAFGAAIDHLETLKKEGKIACWGVSAGDNSVARVGMDRGAEVISVPYNLLHSIDLHRLSGEIMVQRVGVLAHSTLAYGLLAGGWTKERAFPAGDHRAQRWTQQELARRVEQLAALRFLVKRDVITMRAAATRYVLNNHVVSSAILGPRNVQQLEELVRETGGGPTYLPDDDVAALPRALFKVGVLT